MRVDIVSAMSSISAFLTDLKEFNSTQFILGLLSRYNLYNPLVWRQSSSLSPSLSSCRSSGNHSPILPLFLRDTRIGTSCNQHQQQINFIGILFSWVENLNETPNPAIAEFQKEHLIKNAQWLEDDEARDLLAVSH